MNGTVQDYKNPDRFRTLLAAGVESHARHMIQRHDYSACHERDAHRIAHEGPMTTTGKPRKTPPKLMPWDVLKRFGISRDEVAGRIWRDHR